MAEFKLTFEDGSDGYLAQAELDPKEVERRRYAFPEERKFPLTDASKVMSAIKFFNYVDPKDERHLAEAILKRMEELGISEVNVGPTNRFKKYYEAQDGYLKHFGVKGMHWGVWNDETRARRMGLSRTPKEYNYKADGKRLAKSGLEQDFATKGTVWYRTASKDFYNPTATSKIRSKQNRKITKNPEIRRLNAEYDTAVKKHGEYSKEATEALAKFQQKGQDLAVRHISKYRNAYLKDLGEKRTRAGKKALDTALMNEVYLGPATWSNGMNKSYAKALGVPTKIK